MGFFFGPKNPDFDDFARGLDYLGDTNPSREEEAGEEINEESGEDKKKVELEHGGRREATQP